MSTLSSFPTLLLFLILGYVDYSDRIECSSCCKEWYHQLLKRYVRKLKTSGKRYREGSRNCKDFIVNPREQLDLALYRDCIVPDAYIVFMACDFMLCKLQCTELEFLEMMRTVNGLKVKNLVLIVPVTNQHTVAVTKHERMEAFLKLTGLQSLSLNCQDDLSYCNQEIPYLPSLQHLSLRSFECAVSQDTLIHYARTLQELTLDRCSISDVSMFGSIPTLTLSYCEDIVDISALQNNVRVKIICCNSIQDYSQSFTNSRRIEIQLTVESNDCWFDFTRWKVVADLTLRDDWARDCIRYHDGHNQLPVTVKKGYLHGNFVSSVNFTVTEDHCLRDLTLSYAWSPTLTSLANYHLDRVAVIQCHSIRSLQSLKGFGGKNRKVTITYCHQIRDFSPIGHVPIVTIKNCKRFTNPLQVRFVQDLTIVPSAEISFATSLKDEMSNPFAAVHSLTIGNPDPCLQSLKGLEKIPCLRFDYQAALLLQLYVKEESFERLENQQIVLNDRTFQFSDVDDPLFQSLQRNYEGYNHPRHRWKWNWIRKE